MNNPGKELIDCELMKMALLTVQRLINSGHDLEVINASIAEKAVKDISIEVKREVVKEAKSSFDYALVSIGINASPISFLRLSNESPKFDI